jgi:hypothetical protein
VSEERSEKTQVLDLIFEDNRLNVYAGELEVRPPVAPTTTGPYGRRLAAPSGEMTVI